MSDFVHCPPNVYLRCSRFCCQRAICHLCRIDSLACFLLFLARFVLARFPTFALSVHTFPVPLQFFPCGVVRCYLYMFFSFANRLCRIDVCLPILESLSGSFAFPLACLSGEIPYPRPLPGFFRSTTAVVVWRSNFCLTKWFTCSSMTGSELI